MTDRRSESEATWAMGGRKRHRGRWLFAALVVALVAGGGCWWRASQGAGSDASHRTAAVMRGDLTVTATGTIEPLNLVEISSELQVDAVEADTFKFWLGKAWLDPALYGCRASRRTFPTCIHQQTGTLRAVQLVLVHAGIESTGD